MLNPKIQRRNFNGGAITPELWYRTDLELYFSSCKTLKNMVVTPWGGVTRRSPTKGIYIFNNEVYGKPLRYLPFRFSNREFFHIVLTDNSGSGRAWNPKFVGTKWETNDTWENKAAVMVIDPDGNSVDVWGDNFEGSSPSEFDKHLLATNIDPADVGEIEASNINDVIYLTCKGKYPLSEIYRFLYKGSTNYWAFAPNITVGGPFLDENPISSDKVQIYSRDMVLNGNCPGFAKGAEDIAKYVNESVSSDIAKVNQYSHEGQYPYLLYWSGESPHFGNLEESMIRVRCGIEDFQTDWSNKNDLQNNFFRGVMNDGSNIESYDPEFDDPSKASLNCVSPLVPVDGVVRLTTRGAWDGTLILEESTDGITYDELASINSDQGDNNEIIERKVSDWSKGVRVRMARAQKLEPLPNGQEWDNVGCHWSITADAVYLYFRVIKKLSGNALVAMSLNEGYAWPGDKDMPHSWYNQSTSVQDSRKGGFSYLHQGFSKGDSDFSQFRYASDASELKVFESHRWAVGAFGPETGFPFTHAVHQERMCLGGNRTKPNRIWASRVNDWKDFRAGQDDTDSFSFSAQSDSSDGIKWMQSANNFMVGTGNEEVLVSGGTNNMVFSAKNIRVKPQTFYGSANIKPTTAADTVFFVERNAQRIRSLGYDFQTDQYLASDIMILISSLTQGGDDRRVKRIGFCRNPFTSLFVLLDDGTALYFVYEQEQQVKGWSSIEIGGGQSSLRPEERRADIIDSGVNQGEHGDAVYLLVHRTGVDAGCENADEHSLEMYEQHKPGSKPELAHLDCYSHLEVGDWTNFFVENPVVANRMRHLAAHTEYRISQGNDYTGFRIFQFNPSIYPEPSKSNYTDGATVVGYPYQSVVEPTDLVEPFDFGPIRQTPEISLYLHKSSMANIEVNGYPSQTRYAVARDILHEDAANYYNWSDIIDWETGNPRSQSSLSLKDGGFHFHPLTGAIKLSVSGSSEPHIALRFSTSNTLPFNLIGIGINHPLISN